MRESRNSLKKFLIVECKAPDLEGPGSVWGEGARQLQEYLSTITGNHRKFGAVAVGRYVRFYELVDVDLVDFEGTCWTVNARRFRGSWPTSATTISARGTKAW